MGRTGKYRPGEYLVQCDICGRNGYSSEMVKNWKNQFVHLDTCYEPRHPQDKVQVRPDVARAENVRSNSNFSNTFTPIGNVTADSLEPYDESDPL